MVLPTHHVASGDPGTVFIKDEGPAAIDLDSPLGDLKLLTPNIVTLGDGSYRMYYTGMGRGRPTDHAQGYVLSAVSPNADTWTKEDGVRLDVDVHPRSTLRTVCPDVVALPGGQGWRMYWEGRAPGRSNVILSATSADGLVFTVEAGVRLEDPDEQLSYGAPRVVPLPDSRGWRMYPSESRFVSRGNWKPGDSSQSHIVSYHSADGLRFAREEGICVGQEFGLEAYGLYAPEVLRLPGGGWRMYYAAWEPAPEQEQGEGGEQGDFAKVADVYSHATGEVFVRESIKADLSGATARLYSATSPDGQAWTKDYDGSAATILLGPGDPSTARGAMDAVHLTEPCIAELPDGRHRLWYEACDRDGKWRILSATTPAAPARPLGAQLEMIRDDLENLPPLPACPGYTVRSFAPGDEEAWCACFEQWTSGPEQSYAEAGLAVGETVILLTPPLHHC